MAQDDSRRSSHTRSHMTGVASSSSGIASSLNPAARELWCHRPPIGLIELGIHNAFGLSSMRTRDGRGSCDAYCMAKYGVK